MDPHSDILVFLIAAVSDDGIIGKTDGGIPWRLPRDVEHFRRHASHHSHLLLGRKTYLEMEGWFTKQRPLVLSRNPGWRPQIGHVVSDITAALAAVRAEGGTELLVCGGGRVYAAALPRADALILTRVHTRIGCGAPFPEITSEWQEVSRESFPADAENAWPMTFLRLERRRQFPSTQPTNSTQ